MVNMTREFFEKYFSKMIPLFALLLAPFALTADCASCQTDANEEEQYIYYIPIWNWATMQEKVAIKTINGNEKLYKIENPNARAFSLLLT
jgi:hypothetical protein